jgi:hypothetical protein
MICIISSSGPGTDSLTRERTYSDPVRAPLPSGFAGHVNPSVSPGLWCGTGEKGERNGELRGVRGDKREEEEMSKKWEMEKKEKKISVE